VNRNEPVHALRDELAKQTALRTLAQAHDRFSEAEQMYVASGQLAMAEGAHTFALIALRAYRNELDDVKPAGLP
jgi:hypothetical protein